MDIQAYFEEWSLRPGDTARLAISTPHASVRARLVRLLSGPGQAPAGEGRTSDHSDILDATVPGRLQPTVVGSYAVLPLPSRLEQAASVHCWIWPTAPERPGAQTVWSLGDVALVIRAGAIEVQTKGAKLVGVDGPIIGKRWYSVTVTLDGRIALLDLMRLDGKIDALKTASAPARAIIAADALTLAAADVSPTGSPIGAFNGKIDSPTIFLGSAPEQRLAAWREGKFTAEAPWASWKLDKDFASEVAAPTLTGADRRLVNGVERGVTGRNWDGTTDSFLEKPEQYCALQFHDDDMVESGWGYDLEFALPETLKSGVYAVRLEAGDSVNHFPLFVRGLSHAKAPVLFLTPTNTYLAYANDHLASLDFSALMPHDKVVPKDEQYLFDHPEPGRSCYDTHADGTPVRYSSCRRPLFNVRPGFPNWLTGSYRHFPVDSCLVEWLEHVGLDYHVATDEDLEREGRELLDRYAVVVTGSHPEYWTRDGLNILESKLKAGGRIMYLGGNGFYWVTSRLKDKPWVIEIRRDNSGTRCWDAPYGERTHVATSEAGGIWRARGRAPNKLVGVGFSAEGWSKSCGYRRSEITRQAPIAKFFEGVNEDVVGAHGYVLGGAVGDEVDRFEVALESSEHAYLLGSSTGLGNEYQLVIEDLTLSLPDQGGAQRPDQVKADMVLFPVDADGWVFSVGSITYAGALAWNGCDNDLSRLTANVLRAFASRKPVLG
jgi:N,N-dimethylformamidase